jgi:prefoldin subunit 5
MNMTENEKLSQIKTAIEEIKKITVNLGNDSALESKIEEMTKEISRLKKGIGESIDELDQILGEEDARS